MRAMLSVHSINSGGADLAALPTDQVKKLRGLELAKWLVHGPIGISRESAAVE